MKYTVLQFCDFYTATMTYWVTILAMAALPDQAKYVATVLVYNRARGFRGHEPRAWPIEKVCNSSELPGLPKKFYLCPNSTIAFFPGPFSTWLGL